MIRTLVTAAVLVSAGAVGADLPGPDTPGAINPAVTQEKIMQTVCVPNWTSTVRPPVSYTNKLKAQQMQALGMNMPANAVEEDHRVPLACAGNPTDPRNLSPELWDAPYGAHSKDAVESAMHRKLCKGEITLAQCQAVFLAPHDWRDDYDKLYGPKERHN